MTFDTYKEIIEENDTVILYISFNTMYALTVTPTKLNKKGEENEHIYQTSYGALKVKDLIGKRFGTRVQLSRVSCKIEINIFLLMTFPQTNKVNKKL